MASNDADVEGRVSREAQSRASTLRLYRHITTHSRFHATVAASCRATGDSYSLAAIRPLASTCSPRGSRFPLRRRADLCVLVSLRPRLKCRGRSFVITVIARIRMSHFDGVERHFALLLLPPGGSREKLPHVDADTP